MNKCHRKKKPFVLLTVALDDAMAEDGKIIRKIYPKSEFKDAYNKAKYDSDFPHTEFKWEMAYMLCNPYHNEEHGWFINSTKVETITKEEADILSKYL